MPAFGNPAARHWRAGGEPVSSAILYLAIVAIWACVLVPRWLRRSHENPSEQGVVYEQEEWAGPGLPGDQGALAGDTAPDEEDMDPVAWEDPAAPGDPLPLEEVAVHTEYRSVTYSMTTVSVEEAGVTAHDAAAGDGDAAGADDDAAGADDDAAGADPAEVGAYYEAVGHASGGPEPHGWPAGQAGPDHAGIGYQHPHAPPRPHPDPGQARVVRARRRLLTMLVALAIGTAGCTFIGLMPGWVLIVPVALLGLYLLLLREAAVTDAEHARSRAEARTRAVQAAQARALRERDRQAASVAAPTAQVIHLAELAAQFTDQPYDQYTDAEIRAVGD